MARIAYALCGQGRGHTSRGLATAKALRARGHEILFFGGGMAEEILGARDEAVIRVPVLRTVLRDNAVHAASTVAANWPTIANFERTVARLVDALRSFDPHLLITDFEPSSWRAAERLKIPTISFNHQQVVTETVYELPAEHWLDAQVAKAIIGILAPRSPERLLVTSFFFPPVRRP